MDSYVQLILKGIAESSGSLEDCSFIAQVAGTFGGMALVRHPEAGQKFVTKYSAVSSWIMLGSGQQPGTDYSRAQIACGHFVRYAYSYSKSESLGRLLRSQVGEEGESLGISKSVVDSTFVMTQTAGYLLYVRPPTVSLKEQNRVVAGCLERYGRLIDEMMERVDKREAGSAATKAAVSVVNPSGDTAFASPAAGVPVPAPVGKVGATRDSDLTFVAPSGPAGEYAVALAREGLAAYLFIADAWRRGQMEKLRGLLLDNAEPIDDTMFDRLLQTPRAVDQQRQMLLAIEELGPFTPRDLSIEFQARASCGLPTMPGSGGSADVLAAESATLAFTIPKSGVVAKAHLPGRLLFPERARTVNGELRVYMRKIDGKWHWNPFGW